MDHLASERFGSSYDASSGIVRLDDPQRLRTGIASMPCQRLADPHLSFFCERNPGHAEGDELVCCTRFDTENMTLAGLRMLRRFEGQPLLIIGMTFAASCSERTRFASNLPAAVRFGRRLAHRREPRAASRRLSWRPMPDTCFGNADTRTSSLRPSSASKSSAPTRTMPTAIDRIGDGLSSCSPGSVTFLSGSRRAAGDPPRLFPTPKRSRPNSRLDWRLGWSTSLRARRASPAGAPIGASVLPLKDLARPAAFRSASRRTRPISGACNTNWSAESWPFPVWRVGSGIPNCSAT